MEVEILQVGEVARRELRQLHRLRDALAGGHPQGQPAQQGERATWPEMVFTRFSDGKGWRVGRSSTRAAAGVALPGRRTTILATR
jgi:hypothetical protein